MTGSWKTERVIRGVAGSFVLVSLGLGVWVHPAWFLFTAFVGLNLLQSAFTRWCLLESILVAFGMERCCSEPRRPSPAARP